MSQYQLTATNDTTQITFEPGQSVNRLVHETALLEGAQRADKSEEGGVYPLHVDLYDEAFVSLRTSRALLRIVTAETADSATEPMDWNGIQRKVHDTKNGNSVGCIDGNGTLDGNGIKRKNGTVDWNGIPRKVHDTRNVSVARQA